MTGFSEVKYKIILIITVMITIKITPLFNKRYYL